MARAILATDRCKLIDIQHSLVIRRQKTEFDLVGYVHEHERCLHSLRQQLLIYDRLAIVWK